MCAFWLLRIPEADIDLYMTAILILCSSEIYAGAIKQKHG